MKKIMILGSSGMLGHIVCYYLSETKKYRIVDVSFKSKVNEHTLLLDATDKLSLESLINKEKPDVIINCIGILIKGSQEDPANAIYLNAFLPHQLSKILRNVGGRLIHISTDCVFSGNKGDYSENDYRDADDTYGRSKALGEIINDKDLTIRTSIIGPELKQNGEGLFHWFMNQNGEINGYTKAYWSGVTTLCLAQGIENAIEQNIKGLYHLTNDERINKYELLSLIKEIWQRNGVKINMIIGKNVDKSLRNTRDDFNFTVPNYKEMLIKLRTFMMSNKELYPHYNLF
ncbi:MAG: dTDP-4-dehydrorhamnose reductase family protein [Ignavibacteriaceae bacterium]